MKKIELAPELESRLLAAVSKLGFKALYPEQERSVRANIAGHNTLTFLATGGGKTACYVIPSLVLGRVSIVVSPLIALQRDQVSALNRLGIPAALYNSSVSEEDKDDLATYVRLAKRQKSPYFVFVAPESLLTESFFDRFGDRCFDNMIIDEIHCVSTWGNTFRPDYMRLAAVASRLGISHGEGYTATVTPKILSDIYRYAPFKEGECEIIQGDYIRDNLKLEVIYTDGYEGTPKERADKKKSKFLGLLKRSSDGAAIVYCSSRAGCESLYNSEIVRGKLLRQGYSVYLFHAGIEPADKDKVMGHFVSDKRPLVIATNAFGMGIDRADVRQVIHYNNPRNLLGYAQEIGRAGRDGEIAYCTTLFDRSAVESTIGRNRVSLPDVQGVEDVHRSLIRAYKKRSPEARKTFSTSKYLRQMEQIVEGNEEIKFKSSYLGRLRASVSLLKQVGLVVEDVKGQEIQFFKLSLGSAKHQKLIERTEMSLRSEEEQLRLVEDFFSSEPHTQERVWQLMVG